MFFSPSHIRVHALLNNNTNSFNSFVFHLNCAYFFFVYRKFVEIFTQHFSLKHFFQLVLLTLSRLSIAFSPSSFFLRANFNERTIQIFVQVYFLIFFFHRNGGPVWYCDLWLIYYFVPHFHTKMLWISH